MPSCVVVDDARVVRMVARRIFEALHFTVHEAENGAEAVTIIEAQQPDVVLMDWNMPVMDGLEALKAIRATNLAQQPVIIFCTTENELDKITLALEAGASEYIMKPFDADIVRSKLEQLELI